MSSTSHRLMPVALLLSAGVGVASAQAVIPTPSCVVSGQVCTWTFTTSNDHSLVPLPVGVDRVAVVAVGASGGTGFQDPSWRPGGAGGTARASLEFLSGRQLAVFVGSAGGVGGAVGWQDGAGGGYIAGDEYGAGGGGSSDVRVDGILAVNRVLVAGAGGGGGEWGAGGVGGYPAAVGSDPSSATAASGVGGGGGGGYQGGGGGGGEGGAGGTSWVDAAYLVSGTDQLTAGDGPSGDGSVTLSYSLVPGAPTGVSVVAGAGTATASWAAPAHTGGHAIASYTATAVPSGRTCTAEAPSLTCTITGLAGGVAQDVTVTATNAIGAGGESASVPVTPAASEASSDSVPGGENTGEGASGSGDAPPALRATVRCVALACTTTGVLPARATSVSQVATSGSGALSQAREAAGRTIRGKCRVIKGRTRKGRTGKAGRTYSCTIHLRKGPWSVRTTASGGGKVVAASTRAVTVSGKGR